MVGTLQKQKNIKKRWQEYTEELYQKDLNVPDNPDSVMADLEPDVLESDCLLYTSPSPRD